MNVRAKRFPLVDSLRAIAALCVLLTHTAVAAGISGNPHSALSPYAQRLDVGVAIFFLISGLLLYRPFVAARFRGRPAPATGPYAWRRFLRIAPAYWLALTVTALWVGTSAYELGVFSSSGFPTYYLMAQTYRCADPVGRPDPGMDADDRDHLLCLPAALRVGDAAAGRPRRTGGRSATRGQCCARRSRGWSCWWSSPRRGRLVVLGGQSPHQVVITPALDALPAYLDQFALGMGLAVVSAWIEQRGSAPRWVRRFDRAPVLSWVFAAVAFYVVSKRIGINPRFFAPMGRLAVPRPRVAVRRGGLRPARARGHRRPEARPAPADPGPARARVAGAHLLRDLPVADDRPGPAAALELRRALDHPALAVVVGGDAGHDRGHRGRQLLPARATGALAQGRLRRSAQRGARPPAESPAAAGRRPPSSTGAER